MCKCLDWGSVAQLRLASFPPVPPLFLALLPSQLPQRLLLEWLPPLLSSEDPLLLVLLLLTNGSLLSPPLLSQLPPWVLARLPKRLQKLPLLSLPEPRQLLEPLPPPSPPLLMTPPLLLLSLPQLLQMNKASAFICKIVI